MLRDVAGGNGELDALNMCFDKDPECETMAESWYTIYSIMTSQNWWWCVSFANLAGENHQSFKLFVDCYNCFLKMTKTTLLSRCLWKKHGWQAFAELFESKDVSLSGCAVVGVGGWGGGASHREIGIWNQSIVSKCVICLKNWILEQKKRVVLFMIAIFLNIIHTYNMYDVYIAKNINSKCQGFQLGNSPLDRTPVSSPSPKGVLKACAWDDSCPRSSPRRKRTGALWAMIF